MLACNSQPVVSLFFRVVPRRHDLVHWVPELPSKSLRYFLECMAYTAQVLPVPRPERRVF